MLVMLWQMKKKTDALNFLDQVFQGEAWTLSADGRSVLCGAPGRPVQILGLTVSGTAKDALHASKNRPMAWLRDDRTGEWIAVFRMLRNTIEPERVFQVFVEFAKRAHGKPLVCIPLPGDGIVKTDYYPRNVVTLADFLPSKDAQAAPAKRGAGQKFVRGDEDDDEIEAPDLKEDWIASENFTYYVGQPKQGKSLMVAKTAAYITAGGTWDGDGKWTGAWFDGQPIAAHARGSVIIIEEEDKVAQTKARFRAAGCNMAKVFVRRAVPDISVPEQLKEVTDLAEKLGDCRMISFSPLQAAIRSSDHAEPVVRSKFRPLLTWVENRGIALIGVLHVTKDGKALAGSDVLFRVARCVVAFDDGVMCVRNSNIGPTGLREPFKVETVVNKGVKTARIIFGGSLA